MNGATTEPWARTRSPPINTVTMMIGSSQNLRRAPRNFHIWNTRSMGTSEEIGEAVVGRSRRVAALPVRRCGRVVAAIERIAPGEPHHDRNRREDGEENDAHD